MRKKKNENLKTRTTTVIMRRLVAILYFLDGIVMFSMQVYRNVVTVRETFNRFFLLLPYTYRCTRAPSMNLQKQASTNVPVPVL